MWLELLPAFCCNIQCTFLLPIIEKRDRAVDLHALGMIDRGRNTFRYDTFGDQDFWGGTLQIHKAIEGQKLGGVGPGVDPETALAVGLKVDQDALPELLIAL